MDESNSVIETTGEEVIVDLRDGSGRLAGRTVLVTGGSGQVGSSVAERLVADGARVILIGRDMARLNSAVRGARGELMTVNLATDLGSVEDIRSALDFVMRMGTTIDVVVYAAGVVVDVSVRDGSVEDLDEMFLVNVRAPFVLTQLLQPLMSVHGHFVAILGDSETTGAKLVAGATRSLAGSIAAEFPGWRVSIVEPPRGGNPERARRCAESVRYALEAPAATDQLSLRIEPVETPQSAGTQFGALAWS
jgi:hypothetical protein